MRVLNITFPEGGSLEVHVFQVGEHMPGFGGRKHGLTVGPTPSLVTRRIDVGGAMEDTEFEIDSPQAWNWIARAIKASAGRPQVEGPGVP